MYHRARSGKFRDYLEFYSQDNDTSSDPWNEAGGRTKVFDARAQCLVKRGDQNEQYGTVLTDEVVTALMWLDERVENDQVVVWKEVEYEVVHIRPDPGEKSMIVTMRSISK